MCADRKYQVIFCNFSALSIDLWLAAARRTWLLFPLLPYCPPSPLPTYTPLLWLVLCVQNKKEKPSERCLTEILRLRLPPLCWCCPISSFCWQLPKVPLYAKCVAVVICADHPLLGPAICRRRPQLCLGTARLGVTVLQENSFSEFHLHFLLLNKIERGREWDRGRDVLNIFC